MIEDIKYYTEYRVVKDGKTLEGSFDRYVDALSEAERLVKSGHYSSVGVWSLATVVEARPIETIVYSVWHERIRDEEKEV